MAAGFPKKVDTSPEPAQFYRELGRQDMSFEQALAELVDNSISAHANNVDIFLSPDDTGTIIDVQVSDDGHGIPEDQIEKRIMRMGGIGSNPGWMNEHGFGLKNSLSCLTGGERYFRILTQDQRAAVQSRVYIVEGPLDKSPLEVDLLKRANMDRWDGERKHLRPGTGTIVLARTTIRYVNTTLPVKPGRPYESLIDTAASGVSHIEAILEHLGVFYRKWLDDDHRMFLRYQLEDGKVIHEADVVSKEIPFNGNPNNELIDVVVNGATYKVNYKSGTLNEATRNRNRFKIYYQGNLQTQGVDVVFRKRVILPHQLTELFGLARHNSMNNFVGELVLNDAKFRTLNNKTGLDKHDPATVALVEEMGHHEPPHSAGAIVYGEAQLRRKIKSQLEATAYGSSAQENAPLWTRVGVEVDIIHTIGKDDFLYEIKNRPAEPLDVYQLVMYWDASVKDGTRPKLGRLVSPELASKPVERLIAYWNGRTDADGRHYNLEFIDVASLLAGSPRTRSRMKR
jgi:hypothetical protein